MGFIRIIKILIFNLFTESVRSDTYEENHANFERIQSEKDMWEQKFEQKRKALKEIE